MQVTALHLKQVCCILMQKCMPDAPLRILHPMQCVVGVWLKLF